MHIKMIGLNTFDHQASAKSFSNNCKSDCAGSRQHVRPKISALLLAQQKQYLPFKISDKEDLSSPSHGLFCPDAAIALSWLGQQNGGCSEPL
jgi:hypothetical protein